MSALVGVALTGTTNPAVEQIFAAATAGKASATDFNASSPSTSSSAAGDVTTVDQVQVSKEAETRLLYSQGQSAAQIEATLGLPAELVTSYLGITNGVQSVTDAATAVVEGQIARSTPAAVGLPAQG